MSNIQIVNRIHDTIVWGAIFLWWGITGLFKLPNGMDALGIGLILLGLMAARSLNGLATNGLTIALGVLAVVWGGLDLSRSLAHLPLEQSVEFPIMLIALGVTLLALGLRVRNTSS